MITSWLKTATDAVDKIDRVRVPSNRGVFISMAGFAVGHAVREDPEAAKPLYLRLAAHFGVSLEQAEADYARALVSISKETP